MDNRTLLLKIISNYKNNYQNIIKTQYPELYKWIFENTSLLNEPIYKFKTRIYWIINNLTDFPLCKSCGKKLINKNVISIYEGYNESCSVKCAASSNKRKEKIKQTCLKKYGVTNYTQTKEYIDKSKQTCLKKYGTEFSFQSENNKLKSRKTCLEKYGTEISIKNDEVKNKALKTIKEKYGVDNVFKSEEIKEKIKQTNLKKYGVSSPMKNEQIKNKCFEKSHKTILENIWNHILMNDEYSTPNFTKDFYIANYNKNFEFEFICKKCGNVYKSTHFDGKHSRCKKCYPNTSSCGEKELVEFIKKIYNDKIIENSKSIISPYELDIYLPNKKIAFEFDGLYWHSLQILKNKNKTEKYHLNKTKMCKENDIQLIHIFEDEWNNKRNIVKSRIKNLLGIYDKIIYARKCSIELIDYKSTFEFLEENHIQGNIKSSINIGLKYNNTLIAIMTFGKNRIALGSKSKDNCYELLRFCTKQGYHVIGGASKLLKYFEKNYNVKKLISYADYRWSCGNMYHKLGFKLTHISKPNYWYLEPNCLKRIHRFNFRKSVLKNKLNKFDEKLSEKENMINNNYKIIYDCGNMVFEKVY
jgi:hypothetical protein